MEATWLSLRRRLPRKQEVAGAFRSRSCETARDKLAHPCKRGSRGLTPFVLAIGDLLALALVFALALALLVLVKSVLLLVVGVDEEESGALACRWSRQIQYVRQTIIKEGQLVSPSIKSALLEEYTWIFCPRSVLQKLQTLRVARRWKLLVQQPKQSGIVAHDQRRGGGVPPF